MNLLQSLESDKLSIIALYKLILEFAHASGLNFEGSFTMICKNAMVNRTQMYERVDQVKAHMEKIEVFGPGRPICEPVSDSSDQSVKGRQFLEAVLRHRLKHSGSLVEHASGHTTYGDSFVRLVLDLRDTWDSSLKWFCQQVEYLTRRSEAGLKKTR